MYSIYVEQDRREGKRTLADRKADRLKGGQRERQEDNHRKQTRADRKRARQDARLRDIHDEKQILKNQNKIKKQQKVSVDRQTDRRESTQTYTGRQTESRKGENKRRYSRQ